ncbi:hypothetical protein [Bacteroides helcogenes]|uniref:Lipoprotein n=1 Tax=Bacteroides helcogenes (strain ATCC 35417 / DSM 20613 / JCM 6297 / CCUG 15421 / P 36-108) TaxID=693979 RepID=E6SNX9_BACT6|nr:hypothetical protein [Bacteroides helcogenes]ADV42797.1 hypothetical protein Bache_0776 [Bacteroides helcogenes P 36-108]MDY5239627.1 hypothetical protein [Bacteroides helcogenes]
MKQFFSCTAAIKLSATFFGMAAFSLCTLSACSSDDEGTDTPEIVSETIPAAGWQGTAENGVCTYLASNSSDEDYKAYYAFSFKEGICEEAVYNVVFDDEASASYICNALKDGSWADGSDDDTYSMGSTTARRTAARVGHSISRALLKSIPAPTRSASLLGIDCSQKGKIVFIKIEQLKGKTNTDVQYAMKVWSMDTTSMPDKCLFGTYEGSKGNASGKYSCNNIYGLNATKYEVSVTFNSSNNLKTYTTTLTLPNEDWAALLQESLQEDADDYMELLGVAPTVSRQGNVITVDAVVINTVSYDETLQFIIAQDYLLNTPYLASIFG